MGKFGELLKRNVRGTWDRLTRLSAYGEGEFNALLKPKEDGSSTLLYRLFQLALLAAIVVLFLNFALFPVVDNLGAWGDFFGGVLNPILTFITFMGLLITIVLQQTELKDTREELRRSADALELQIKSVNRQNFENTFFQMLALHNSIVSSMDVQRRKPLPTLMGRDCFRFFHGEMKKSYDAAPQISDERARALFAHDQMWTVHRQDLAHYYRYLYNVIRFVKESEVDKVRYIRILRAQISDYELLVLFYNGITERALKFKAFIEEFALFDNLPHDVLLDQNHLSFYEHGAYEEANRP